jgi:hypothetical protein
VNRLLAVGAAVLTELADQALVGETELDSELVEPHHHGRAVGLEHPHVVDVIDHRFARIELLEVVEGAFERCRRGTVGHRTEVVGVKRQVGDGEGKHDGGDGTVEHSFLQATPLAPPLEPSPGDGDVDEQRQGEQPPDLVRAEAGDGDGLDRDARDRHHDAGQRHDRRPPGTTSSRVAERDDQRRQHADHDQQADHGDGGAGQT